MLFVKTPRRGVDHYGSGAYLASRGGRLHNGVDFAAFPGSDCLSLTAGKVTKIGFPYRYDAANPEKAKYRYVEVTFLEKRLRYFYLNPAVSLGDRVNAGDVLGAVQDLSITYKEITPHVHFEIKDGSGNFIDPDIYIASLG